MELYPYDVVHVTQMKYRVARHGHEYCYIVYIDWRSFLLGLSLYLAGWKAGLSLLESVSNQQKYAFNSIELPN